MMKKQLLLFMTMLLFIACTEDVYVEEFEPPTDFEYFEPLTFESNAVVQDSGLPLLKEAIIDLQILSEDLLRSPIIAEELFQLGRVDHYADYYIGLDDLLLPSESELYNKANLPVSIIGAYRDSFYQKLQEHPEMVNLIKYVDNLTTSVDHTVMNSQGEDEEMELYYYCPYCLDTENVEPTIVPTTVDEADEAPGNKLLEDGTLVGVMVDDDYASENTSYIITANFPPHFEDEEGSDSNGENNGGGGYGSGGSNDIGGYNDDNLPIHDIQGVINGPEDVLPGINIPSVGDNYDFICDNLIRRVHTGHMILHEQYDPLISLTGNGGESEIRFVRIDGYLEVAEDGDFLEHLVPRVYGRSFKRRWIRNEQWVNVNAVWDDNWECDNLEQTFAIYEEDTEGTVTLSGNMTTKISLPIAGGGSVEQTRTVGFSTDFTSKDELITQWVINAESFFQSNQLSRGCEPPTRLMPEYGGVHFSVNDCGTDATYVLPHDYVD